jgi:hypothetical protein
MSHKIPNFATEKEHQWQSESEDTHIATEKEHHWQNESQDTICGVGKWMSFV